MKYIIVQCSECIAVQSVAWRCTALRCSVFSIIDWIDTELGKSSGVAKAGQVFSSYMTFAPLGDSVVENGNVFAN